MQIPGQSFARPPSEKQARERERSGFGMRMPGQRMNADNIPTSDADRDALLAEICRDRLELGASSLEEYKAKIISQKVARVMAEELSEAQIEEFTCNFSQLRTTTTDSRNGCKQAGTTPSASRPAGNNGPNFDTPPSTGHMEWSPAGHSATGVASVGVEPVAPADRTSGALPHAQVPHHAQPDASANREGGLNSASSFQFSAATDATTSTQAPPSHKKPSPRKVSGRRLRPRAQIATAAQAPKAPSPVKAPAPAADSELFTQRSFPTAFEPVEHLKQTRSETSRAANVIREALGAQLPGKSRADNNSRPSDKTAAHSSSQDAPSFTFGSTAPSGPTAPFPQMFNATFPAPGHSKPNVSSRTANCSKPQRATSTSVPPMFSAAGESGARIFPKGTAPAVPAAPPTLPVNPFSPDATVPRGGPGERSAPSKPAKQPAAEAPAGKPVAPESAFSFTFGKPAASMPEIEVPETPNMFGNARQNSNAEAPAPQAPPAAAQAAADAPGVFDRPFASPTAKPPRAAQNPFGSPTAPLGRAASAGQGSPGQRPPVAGALFGGGAEAGPAAARAPETPVFVAKPRVPVAGATPPSTDGPSTAGSPFGGCEEAESWFRAPTPGGSARRRGGVLRRHRDNIHATGPAAAAAAPPAAPRAAPAPAAAAAPLFRAASPPAPQQAQHAQHAQYNTDSDAEPGAASSGSEASTGACAPAPGVAGMPGPAAVPVAGQQTPAGGPAAMHYSPMSTGLPWPAPLASQPAQSPPRQRYTARRPPDVQQEPAARMRAPRGHQAKENHVPPNAQLPGGSHSATTADDVAAKLAAVEDLRRTGNEKFKERKWAEASADYSSSIDLLQKLGARAPPDQIALLLSNRAAVLMMQKRPKDALADCEHALKMRPHFARVIERAAKCHLRLGNFAAADAMLLAAQAQPLVPKANAKVLAERLAEVRQCSVELDAGWAAVAAAETPEAAADAERVARRLLENMDEAFEVKLLLAAALLRGGRWRPAEAAARAAWKGACGPQAPRAQLQAWWLQCETLYAEGELEKCVEALERGITELEALERREPADPAALEVGLAGGAAGRRVPLPPVAQVRERVADIRQVLQGRSAGNTAFNDKRFEEAARLYTLAIGERRVAAPAFWARLHSNRAAAYQAQEKWVDALSDCGRARALDPDYHKVLSRLATLHEAVRRPGAALGFLQHLQECPDGAAAVGGATTMRRRLADLKVKDAGGGTADHFKLLHLPLTATAGDVRSAYRKLALGNHPDKARTGCKYAASLSGPAMTVRDAGLLERVVAAADDLFKVINEACTVLSDNVKRDKCARELGGGGSRFDGWSYADEDPFFEFDVPRRPQAFGRRRPGHRNFG